MFIEENKSILSNDYGDYAESSDQKSSQFQKGLKNLGKVLMKSTSLCSEIKNNNDEV